MFAATGIEALAQNPAGQSKPEPANLVDGEVRKVDRQQGKVTLKHGPIKSLDMPAMTMAFPVSDKRLLDAVKAGDRVRFQAVNQGGRTVVTELRVTP